MAAHNLIIKILICLAGVITTPASDAETSMTGFSLNSCSVDEQKCLVVTAEKTEGSKLKMLHRFGKPSVTIVDKGTARTLKLEADSGYLDVAENQLVLFSKNKLIITETSVDLTTMEVTSQSMEAQ